MKTTVSMELSATVEFLPNTIKEQVITASPWACDRDML